MHFNFEKLPTVLVTSTNFRGNAGWIRDEQLECRSNSCLTNGTRKTVHASYPIRSNERLRGMSVGCSSTKKWPFCLTSNTRYLTLTVFIVQNSRGECHITVTMLI